MSLKKIIKDFCPPIIWSRLHAIRHHRLPKNIPEGDDEKVKVQNSLADASPISVEITPVNSLSNPQENEFNNPTYQGVAVPFLMSRLHQSKFSYIHEKYASLDTHINRDLNLTRLRNYTIISFAELSLSLTRTGDFLTAGVSFGTTALVTAELLNFQDSSRKFYLIDPFAGNKTFSEKGNTNYNTDYDLVKSRWNCHVEAIWIKKFLSNDSLTNITDLAFIHLNTGDFDAEIQTIPTLFDRLLPGGFMIFDLYGWLPDFKQREVDLLLEKLSAHSFQAVTKQLIIYRDAK